eukprot:GHVU01158056.1.p1 GENE.GHVU01158056.1~~GHVU01158056.1.p1  ORF type:complete len:114 (+),score=8.43 GHVU01158056.1:239-580(+)
MRNWLTARVSERVITYVLVASAHLETDRGIDATQRTATRRPKADESVAVDNGGGSPLSLYAAAPASSVQPPPPTPSPLAVPIRAGSCCVRPSELTPIVGLTRSCVSWSGLVKL